MIVSCWANPVTVKIDLREHRTGGCPIPLATTSPVLPASRDDGTLRRCALLREGVDGFVPGQRGYPLAKSLPQPAEKNRLDALTDRSKSVPTRFSLR